MRQKLASCLMLAGLLVPRPVLSAPMPQGPAPLEDPEILAILDEMSPEQRVGQLFLVTFTGTDVTVDSDVGRLVRDYRVGGVVVRASHDNFTDEGDMRLQVLQLTDNLQSLAFTDFPTDGDEASPVPPLDGPYVPLFVGVEQEGGDYASQFLEDVTPVPSSMALGASWDPTLAEKAGIVAGSELDAMGLNLFLGPSLDVLERTQPSGGELSVGAFGGDPYWVAQMGAAYVRGLHKGSEGHLVVVPTHFPGLGSADRPTDVEVSSVPRSLSRLVQVDLAPFFAVTGMASDPDTRADGVLTAHIRYLGFQGDNPRVATRPISLDPQALQVLTQQPQIATWRAEGGLLVSGALGQRSVRRFYDPSEASFANRRIAQDAFLAGNDLLYLGEFGPSLRGDQTETVIDTISFFVQKYNEDPTFQARVDQSVARILRQKLDQYGSFSPERVQRSRQSLAEVQNQGFELSVEVAQSALTLLSPSATELVDPPQGDDQIVIFTDTRPVAQCSSCQFHPLISLTALGDAILGLYGPTASGLIQPGNIQSFSFVALKDQLGFRAPVLEEGQPTPEPGPVSVALDNADWIVFLMLDSDPAVEGADAVKRFLAERPGLASSANVVVMAMGAPYYLDSTEISKLTAYYVLYDRDPAFVSMAARALFQEVLPEGASPVTVSGMNYDLLTVTTPDPSQVIELFAGDASSEVAGEAAGTPPALELDPGDTLRVRTGVIRDRNGHQVPDGTPVDFDINFVNEGLHTAQRATTVGGVAQSALMLERVGQIEITATSEPAQLSFTLVVNVQESGATVVLQPPALPTATNVPTPLSPAQQAGLEGTPTEQPPAGLEGNNGGGHLGVTLADFLVTVLGLLVMSAFAFRFGQWRGAGQVNNGLLFALPSVVGGLVVYNFYALGLPGTAGSHRMLEIAMAAWGGAVLGFGVVLGWVWWRARKVSPRSG